MVKTILTICLILTISSLVSATTCSNKANEQIFKELVKDTSVIFLGKAISIGQSDGISTPVTFQIEQSWKGVETQEITVNFIHDSNVSESLLIPQIGASGIIYATRNETGKIFSSYCQMVNNSQERLEKELGKGKVFEKPLAEQNQQEISEGFWSKIWKTIKSFFS
jgi:hypothetical protein